MGDAALGGETRLGWATNTYSWFDLRNGTHHRQRCAMPDERAAAAEKNFLLLGRWDAHRNKVASVELHDPPAAQRRFSSVHLYDAGAALNYDDARLALSAPASLRAANLQFATLQKRFRAQFANVDLNLKLLKKLGCSYRNTNK